MKVIKCDRCGNIYPSESWSDTVQINNTPRIDLCEKCMNELEFWLSYKNINKLDKTDNTVEDNS